MSSGHVNSYYPQEGAERMRDTAYKIDKAGFFVIMKVTNSAYDYNMGSSTGMPNSRIDCNKLFGNLKYDAAIKELKTTFNLEESINCYEPSLLTRDIVFDRLPKEIFARLNKYSIRPSFLMFFLMAPSLERGQFLLDRGAGERECHRRECKGSNHSLQGRRGCYARRISDFVREIQQAKDGDVGFAGIPKIFIIQTVSGFRRDRVRVYPKCTDPSKVPKVADDFVPQGSDTFVFHVHTEETVDWVNDRGFYLIHELCEAIKATETQMEQCNEMMAKVNEAWNNIAKKKASEAMDTDVSPGPVPPGVKSKRIVKTVTADTEQLELANEHMAKLNIGIQLSTSTLANSFGESLAGRWWDDLCTTTTAKIMNFVKMNDEKKEADSVTRHYHHMMPQISSTLRWKLSLTDILKHQDTDTKQRRFT